MSPFLFNIAFTGLAVALPVETRSPLRCTIYADDVALWGRGPRRCLRSIHGALQMALEAALTFLDGIGLAASPGKTEALLIHPLALARQYVHQLRIGNTPSHGGGRSQTDHIPGACDRSQADLKHAAKSITAKVHRVQGAVRRLQQHGRGFTVRWGLRLNQVAASSTLLYVLPLLMLSPARQQQLEGLHRRDTILGLPKESPVAATLAEAGEWPLAQQVLHRALRHIARLH